MTRTGLDLNDYYPSPYSLPTLTPQIRTGLAVIGSLALLSILSTSSLLIFLTYRFFTRRQKISTTHINTDQCTVLIFNLLLADLFQSLALVISFHWLYLDGIFAPSIPCWIQAGFLHLGDVGSGSFVLAIAVQTMSSVVRVNRIEQKWFLAAVGCIWVVVICLTIGGPLHYGQKFFTRAGNWCWISMDYEAERLWLHYLWIFLDEFGTLVIYLSLCIYLFRRLNLFSRHAPVSGATTPASSRISKATRTMLLYPTVYVILTLPLATLRMMSDAGHTVSTTALLAAGAMITSCGWVDAATYAFTRHILTKSERRDSALQRRRTNETLDDLERQRSLASRGRAGSSKDTLMNPMGRTLRAEHLEYSPDGPRVRAGNPVPPLPPHHNHQHPRSPRPEPEGPKDSFVGSLGGITKETTVEVSVSRRDAESTSEDGTEERIESARQSLEGQQPYHRNWQDWHPWAEP